MFSDKIFFLKNSDPSPFDTDLCCRYEISRGFHYDVAFIKCFILRRMQQKLPETLKLWTGNQDPLSITGGLGFFPVQLFAKY